MSDLAEQVTRTVDRVLEAAATGTNGGFDAALWDHVSAAGLDRLLLPEHQGGMGDAFALAVTAATRYGGSVASVPLIETLVANWCLGCAGIEVPDGPKAFVAGLNGDPASIDSSGRLHWQQAEELVWEPAAAQTVVLAERNGEPVVAYLDAPLAGDVGETIAGEPLRFAVCPPQGLAFVACAPWPATHKPPMALLALLKAASIAGACETVVGMAIEHANTRVQFGRPIGEFQAVQHMIAHMAAETAAAVAAVQLAGGEFENGNGTFACAVAKSRASEAAGLVASAAHQVHGAVGFTAEFVLQRFTRRLLAWRDDAGDETYWYERIGRSAIQVGQAGLWPGITSGLKI